MSGKKPPYTGIEKLLHTILYNKTQVSGVLIRVFLKLKGQQAVRTLCLQENFAKSQNVLHCC